MFTDALSLVVALFIAHPLATAFLVVALEVPRYTFSIFVVGLNALGKKTAVTVEPKTVSAIVPVFNGGLEIFATVQSLLDQRQPLHQIIIVDDGSNEAHRSQLRALVQDHATVHLLTHRARAGKSAAINHAACIATGELLLTIDHDTRLDPDACRRLAQVFDAHDVAAASGNLLVTNQQRNPLTSLQSLEYMLSIGIGKLFLKYFSAISCCSGAFSMFRASAFRSIGGLNVGPGEDLEITLRLRQAGYKISFVDDALAETTVPHTIKGLYQQRLRWDGDALAIRVLMYRELSFFKRRESLSNSLQRLDYIFLELLPTLVFPFYLVFLWLAYDTGMVDILVAVYIALFWLYALNITLGMIITKRALSWLDLLVLPVMPLYQGLVMRLLRFVAISDEILLARSQHDPYVPPQIRQALYGKQTHE